MKKKKQLSQDNRPLNDYSKRIIGQGDFLLKSVFSSGLFSSEAHASGKHKGAQNSAGGLQDNCARKFQGTALAQCKQFINQQCRPYANFLQQRCTPGSGMDARIDANYEAAGVVVGGGQLGVRDSSQLGQATCAESLPQREQLASQCEQITQRCTETSGTLAGQRVSCNDALVNGQPLCSVLQANTANFKEKYSQEQSSCSSLGNVGSDVESQGKHKGALGNQDSKHKGSGAVQPGGQQDSKHKGSSPDSKHKGSQDSKHK